MIKEYRNPKIEILPEHIIDQIKAGEVLERPASLVKELIENSLDAGSTEINLHLIENGLDLLSIEDNGHGMTFDNLPYAFLRHATSKLKTYDDLFRLRSFGFRGEALASVAASARITCTTQPRDLSADGGKIIIHGGAQELLIPQKSSSCGTSLYIKDLFYNTPARLKFIKSKMSEKSSLKKVFYSFILSNNQCAFSIKWDEKEREIFKAEDLMTRISQVFFNKTSKDKAPPIWHSLKEYEDSKVEVYFTPSTHTSPQYRHHYLFVNNRFFQDKSLHQSLLRTLDPIWKFGESGHYMVKITTHPEEIDVNVHPNKTQIKFLKPDVIYSLLVTGLKETIKEHTQTKTSFSSDQTAPLQNPFFSREEIQNFDLINLANQSSDVDQHYSPMASATYLNSQSTHEQSPLIGMIGTKLFLYKKNEQFYLGNINHILSTYLTQSISEFITKEELSGPLLISEPFKIPLGKIDKHFEELKSIGFELDRLNPELIALRTLPRFAPQVLSKDIAQCLINYFLQPKVSVFNIDAFSLYASDNWAFSQGFQEHLFLQILNQIDLNKNNSLVPLTEKNLMSLFK